MVPGISYIHFHILEFFSILVLFLIHSGISDTLAGRHLLLGIVTPQVARHTNREHVLKRRKTGVIYNI